MYFVTVLQKLQFLFLSLLAAVIVYPFIIPILILVFFYKNLVKLVVQRTDPSCREIISGLSGLIVGHDPYNKPALSLSPYALLSEKLDREHVSHVFAESIIKRNLFPELKQRLVRKWGYYFWKDVENFKPENHIRYHDTENYDRPILRSELRGELGEKIVYSGFDKRYSPWELVILPNVIDPENPEVKSAIFLRVNHCLMDGLSVINFAKKLSTRPWEWPRPKTFYSRTERNKFFASLAPMFFAMKLSLTLPYYILKVVFFSNDSSEFLNNAMKIPTTQQDIVFSRNRSDPKRISRDTIKRIANSHQVGVSSVMTAIAAAATSQFIDKKCRQGFSKPPKNFVMQLALPLPNYPEKKLTNHWTPFRLTIPTNSHNGSVEILNEINTTFRNLVYSTEPLTNYLMLSTVGNFPIFLQPDPMKSGIQQTVLFSNFPGPKSSIDLFGYKSVDWCVFGSVPAENAFVIMAQNLYDNFWIDFAGVSTLLQNQEDSYLMENCLLDVVRLLYEKSF